MDDFPTPPTHLTFNQVQLRFVQVVPGDIVRGFVPYFHFRILLADGTDVGHINFRVGDTPHVQTCAGHIGFEIRESARGNGYAWQACRAVAPFVRTFCKTVIITCDPGNLPSRRTIEGLGAEFIEEAPVPRHDPHYLRGSRVKRRYRWEP